MINVNGRIAIVTGGTRGLGSATCQLLLDQGATVIACDINQEQSEKWLAEMRDKGYKNIDVATADVASFSSCEAAIKDIIIKYGRVDILVNNAGITRDKTFIKMEEKQWQQVIHTNLDGMFNVTKQVLPSMLENKFGRIINISSVVGLTGNFGQTNYAAAKAGILGFTKSLALETARKNITVNAICPGFIATEMTEQMPEKTITMINSLIPMQRMGKPSDIARTVLFLASDDAEYISGTEISVNGAFYR